MDKTTKLDQPTTNDLLTQGSSTEQADAQSAPAVTRPAESPATPPSDAVQATHSGSHATSKGWETTWMVLLVVSLSLASGAIGALFSSQLFPPPPPVKIGMISLTRLTRAIVDTEPATSASFATRFDSATKQLVDAEPGLVLFVKEAVIDTGQIVDYTNALLPLFTSKNPKSTVSPPTTEPLGAAQPAE